MMSRVRVRRMTLCALLAASLGHPANATTINFDDQGITGPSTFGGPEDTRTISTVDGNVTFSGGTFLTNTANLPADQTTVYGTVSDPQYSNPLTVTFQNPVTNFFLDVLNGNTHTVSYTVADNAGNSSTFSLPPNLSSGQTTIGFAATGTVITILAQTNGFFDFFIDNVNFNAPLPPSLSEVPLPASLPLFVSGLAGLGLLGRRRKKKAIGG